MTPDPRCPHCSGKVSATATWCMHCGEDFAEPVDAGGNDLASALERGDADDALVLIDDSGLGPKAVGAVLAVVALVTLPLVSPSGTTPLYLLAVVGVGYLAAKRPSAVDAVERGLQLLALVPFLLWLYVAVSGGTVGVGRLLGPVVYAAIALFALRRITARRER